MADPIVVFPVTEFDIGEFAFVSAEPEAPLALLPIREDPKYRRQDFDGDWYYMKDGKRVYA